MGNFSAALVWLGFFAAVFLGWYFYLKARNKERMALIERDKDVSEIYAKREIKFVFPWLKLGIILTGFSLGWISALFAIQLLLKSLVKYNEEVWVLGIIFLFTSVSVLVAYFVDKPKK
ncbi:MAG: hypothetical protein JXR31_07265 [Prolixibacteraceae bacterium]|nr:hypothetical protein [Prolixibacteraceae bacterium]MBN2774032.1 hypothetical protein [Prolixibacteraceae bacterium]